MHTTYSMSIPFPKEHPEFQSTPKLLAKISRLEGFIEMGHDLDDVMHLLSATRKLQADSQLSLQLGGGLLGIVPSALGQSALIIYARCFNSSTGRTRLSPRTVFADDVELKVSHDYFCGIRDSFIAHQGSNANQHHLFVLPATARHPIRLQPEGSTSRLVSSAAIPWENFIRLVKATQQHLERAIANLSNAIVAELSTAQREVINTMDAESAISVFRKKHQSKLQEPFAPRAASRDDS